MYSLTDFKREHRKHLLIYIHNYQPDKYTDFHLKFNGQLLLFSKCTTGYVIKSCRDISFEFISKCYEVIHKYCSGENQKTYCFNKLGTDQNLKYYGNECNVMAEILLSRHDLFIAHGQLTHITTNLSAS